MKSPNHTTYPLRVYLAVLPVLGLAAWYLLKVFQFQTSPESYDDGLVTLQLSRGWLEGRPLLFDNIYGNHALQHNHYFILLTGFLTMPMGVYGLFFAYLILLGIFFRKWYVALQPLQADGRETSWLTVIFFAFGPMAYFIYLDYFGWHSEQYFLPLLALLSLSLARRGPGTGLTALLLTLLVKETAPVMIWSLLMVCSVIDLILHDPSKPRLSYFLNRRNLLVTGACFALFCLGLWWISHLNGDQPSRLDKAISRLDSSRTLIAYLLLCGLIGSATFGLGLLPFIPWLRAIPRKGLILSVLAGTCLVLLVVYTIEGLFYLPVIYPGVAYPPRIGGLWSLLLGTFVFLSYRMMQQGIAPERTALNWVLAGGLVQFLLAPFLVAHHFNFDVKPSRLNSHVSYLLKTGLGLHPYPEGLPRQLDELARQLPAGSDVVVPAQYMRYFQNVYPSPWTFEGRPYHVFRKPVLFIYQKGQVGAGVYQEFPGKGYLVVPHESLLILADSNRYKPHLK